MTRCQAPPGLRSVLPHLRSLSYGCVDGEARLRSLHANHARYRSLLLTVPDASSVAASPSDDNADQRLVTALFTFDTIHFTRG